MRCTTATSGLGTFGAWTKTTVNDASLTAIDTTDYFGREVAKTDFGGHVYAYTYDLAGRLLTTTATGVDTVDTYYNTNQLASVTNGSNVSTYKYDVAGNRTNETFANAAGTYESATTTWDALNRMVTYTDTGGTEGAPATVSWQYDLNSNIRRMQSTAPSLDAYGAITPGGTLEDYWYKYDSMNRFVTTQASFDTGSSTIYLAENGPSENITYDAAGERIRVAYTTSHSFMDPDVHEMETVVKETDEVYTYTADGYLAQVNTVVGTNIDYYAGDPLYLHIPPAPIGTGVITAVYTYDAMARVTDYVENDQSGAYAYERSASYDNKSEVTGDVVTSVRSDGTYVSTTSYDYGAAVTVGGTTTYTGAYQGGDVTHSHTTTMKGSSAQPTTDTVNTYVWWDSAQQDKTFFTPDTSHSLVYESDYHYDTLGHISSVGITDGRPRTVTFVTDNDNEVLRRDEADGYSTGDPHEIHWYFNGVPVGDVTNNGTSNVDYAVSISEHIGTPGTGPFLNGSATATSYADFDESYNPINGLNYDSTASSYTVNSGDTLESIAQQLWGDSSYWYMIADANGLSSDADLVSGMDLIIPNKIHNDSNNATTYSVYDPNEALGNDNPTAPKVPKHHGGGCGVVGQIIMAVVAVVVAYYAPYLLPVLADLGAVGSAAASAVIGSVVSQGVGLAIGAESKFSFAQVAMAAISAGIGAEVGPATGIVGTDITSAVERGVIGNVVTQGVEVATGLQKKFDFANVAAAGVSAGFEAGLAGTNMDGFARGFVSGMAGDIAGAAVRTLTNGSDFGDNIIAGLPNAFAEGAQDYVQGLPQPQSNTNAPPGTQVVDGHVVAATQIVPLSGDASLQYTPPSAPQTPLTEGAMPDNTTGSAPLGPPVEVSELPSYSDDSTSGSSSTSTGIDGAPSVASVPVPTPRPFGGNDLTDAEAAGYSKAEIVAHLTDGDTYNASEGNWYDQNGYPSIIVLGPPRETVNRSSYNPIFGTRYFNQHTGRIGPIFYQIGAFKQDILRGATMQMRYMGKNTNGLQWLQTYQETRFGQVGAQKIDDEYSPNPPFTNKGGPAFEDNPYTHDSPRTLNLETTLVRLNANGGYDVVSNVTWGYSYDGNTISLIMPQAAAPSPYQQSVINKLGRGH